VTVTIIIQTSEPVNVQAAPAMSCCEEAAEIWRGITPEQWEKATNAWGGPVDRRARKIVKSELDRRHPGDELLFTGMIPKMLATQGINGHAMPEHLAPPARVTDPTLRAALDEASERLKRRLA
jgi:hypothetical protein